MHEVSQDEQRDEQITSLQEKVASLEKENGELRNAVQELEANVATYAGAIVATAGRCSNIENAILNIVEHVQQQEVFNASVRTSVNALDSQVQKHQDNFNEVVRIFKKHEEFIVKHGAAAEEMTKYINALVEDAEKKHLWISGLMKESQAQEQVLRQHHMRQQVLAEVMKTFVFQQQQPAQQPQGQQIPGAGPSITDLDDEDDDQPDFQGGPNPHDGPPNGGPGQVTRKPPRSRKHKGTVKKL